ncbi:Fis family transcriptional regulator [Methylophaga pinxianii]|uniref:Fis family transcriptional regulator n=1 Tax=Methylophaga pinxianii TaxID=2881052 RepID=UPI001CF150A9|nr:Fis family transcriptional regulator [Methylophaga pinxianii]MCB2426791.1 Fis family transcriptional regulator [Methylophaga pinxianii]UPH46556.1 Fis family transcriptional regulator [Methylophaga pinxianii]
MRKTDKKIDNELRLRLTDVCEQALKDIAGFQWLTHLVNYDDFPNSLMVVCVFDTNENLNSYLRSDDSQALISLISSEFRTMHIKLKRLVEHISYDTEEDCLRQHNGNWALRLG